MKRIRRITVLLALVLVIYGLLQGGSTQAAPPVIAGCQVFPSNNVWNTPIDTLPVHASSNTWVNTIGPNEPLWPDFGSGEWPPGSGSPIGIPYITVPGTQPLVNVTFEYDDESDPGPYPIPPNAPIEGGPNSDGDRHVLVLDRDNCILYELYDAHKNPNNSWNAGSGAIWDFGSNELRPAGWTSADAAGLPILPGLVLYDEVLTGEITHAIRFTVPQTRSQYIWPARHEASDLTGPQYPPMGARFRLKASFNISGYSPQAQVILIALKKYGMILADNGSEWYISGAPDPRWDNDILAELHDVEGHDFEAIDESTLMIDPDSGEADQSHVQPHITINNVTQAEGSGGGTTAFNFTVSLSHDDSEETVTVNFATANGTATLANSDYVANSGTLTFDPGETTQPVTVLVNRDDFNEPAETFFVNLSAPVNGVITDNQGLGTISNDDQVGDPTGLARTVVGETQINLTWNDNSTTESAYEVERSPNGTSWSPLVTLPANSNSHSDTTVVCNTTYFYRVRAYRAFDNAYSEYSNVVNGTTPVCTMLVQSDHATMVVREGSWATVANGSASGGAYLTASTQNDVLSLVFEGNLIEVIYVASPGAGTYAIEVDNTVQRTVNTDNPSTQFLAKSTIDYLTNTTHVVRIYPVSGTVAIDAFRILQRAVPAPPAATNGTAPVDVSYTQTPTFRWNHVATADWYYLNVNGPTVHKRWYAALNVCNGATCSVTMTSNLALGGYTWQVLGANEGGNSAWSPLLAFDLIQPGSLTLGNPTGNIPTTTPIFNWSTARDATWYRLWIVNASSAIVYDRWMEASTICVASNCTHQPTSELSGLGNLNFTWNVQAYAPIYGIGITNGPRNFTVQAPSLTSPTGNVNHASGALTYTWNGVAGATWYVLYIGGPNGFSHNEWLPASGNCVSNVCTFTPAVTPASQGAHSWYVRGYSGLGYTAWSVGQNFTLTVPLPGVATKIAPINNPVLTNANVTFSWQQVAGATGYQLYLAGPPGSSPSGLLAGKVGVEVTCSAGTCSRTLNLSTNGEWAWYLAASNVAGVGAWSAGGASDGYGVQGFALNAPTVPMVTKISPVSTTVNGGTVTFSWQPAANATAYDLYVGRAGFWSDYRLWDAASICAATCNVTLVLPATGNYTWYLRGKGAVGFGPWGSGGSDFGAANFTLNATLPPMVVKQSPAHNGTVTSNAVTLTWTKTANTDAYEIYLAGPGGYVDFRRHTPGQTATCDASTCSATFYVPALGVYQWYMRAWSPAGFGPWGSGGSDFGLRTFNVQSPAPAANPTLVAPADSAIISTGTTVQFQWTAVANASWYDVVLVNRNTGAIISHNWISAANATCEAGGTCTSTLTIPKGAYRWAVLTWGPGSSGVPVYQAGVTPTRIFDKLGL